MGEGELRPGRARWARLTPDDRPADRPPSPTREKTGIPKNPGRRDLGLKATLLFPDRDIVEKFYVPIIYTACRTCYSEQDPQTIFQRSVAGDFDAAEDAEAHLAPSSNPGTAPPSSTSSSRSPSAACREPCRTSSCAIAPGVAFDQQSQRYVTYKGAATMLPHSIAEGDPDLRERYEAQVDGALGLYGDLLGAGVPGEDARFVFPNATRTNLVMTTNLRALIHMSGLRLCTMAQWEIRRLFQLIRHEIFTVSPFLGSFLAPSACRSAIATSSTTATATARSGPTRTASWRPGPRRRRRPGRPDESSRRPEPAVS